MARLKHIASGQVVEVRDDKVELMGSEWESADSKPATAKKATAKKAAAKKSE